MVELDELHDCQTPPHGRKHSAMNSWRDIAPDVLTTFASIERCATQGLDATIQVPMRRAIAAILGESAADDPLVADDDRAAACVAFTEQFVVDVAGITDEHRRVMTAAMGADAFMFVQTLFVADVFTRARVAVARLFDDTSFPETSAVPSPEGPDDLELWPLLERFIRQVALLRALDPLTSELVRLRGARLHNCRLCRSRRSVKAIEAAGGEQVFDDLDDYERADFTERHRVALRLTDALVTQPRTIDAAMVADVRQHFTTAEITEIVLDVVRNAANKIAVAFGGDAPVVNEGVEFYDIDAGGDVIADVDIDVVRVATAV